MGGKIEIGLLSLIVVFLVFTLLQIPIFGKCTVARPYFGSINCEETGAWSNPIYLDDEEIWSCDVPNCRIEGITIKDIDCGLARRGLTIKQSQNGHNYTTLIKCDTLLGNLGDECAPYFSKDITSGTQIKIDFWCYRMGYYNPSGNPQVTIKYKPIKLKLHIDSGEKFKSGTEYCNINPIWNKFKGKQLTNNNILKTLSMTSGIIEATGHGLSSIPQDNEKILQPKNLEVGQGYWLVYEWVTRPALIINYFNNMPVWCNAIDHSLTKFKEVTTQEGSCYFIPTERLSKEVECCSTDECKTIYSEQSIQCTDDFKCGYKKSCYSDYDCGGVSKTCQSENGKYYLVSSKCDKSRLDSYDKGKCVSTKEEVRCCTGQDGGPNICGSGNYCDYENGCQVILKNCPSGKCCISGRNYKEKDCPSGKECCTISGSYIGECGECCTSADCGSGFYCTSDYECELTPKTAKAKQSNNEETTTKKSSSYKEPPTGRFIESPTFLEIILILIIGGIGAVGYFLWQKEISKPVILKQEKVFSKQKKSGKKCPNCGKSLKPNAKFCTNCGKKIK